MMSLFWIIQLLLVPAVSPLGVGLIRKLKARMQNRHGASVFQPYRDIWKLLHKDEVISKDASWIFRFASLMIFAVTLVVGASIPLLFGFLSNRATSDVLVIVYTMAIGTFFLALAGLDTGGAFGGFGSSREVTVSALAEGGFIFSLLTLALIAGTTNVFGISSGIHAAFSHSAASILLAFVGFMIVLLAENARFPFDNPSTHLELTMIHEAMLLEHSGKRLALMEWASANKLFIFSSLAVNLFFPWGIAGDGSLSAVLVAVASFAGKMIVVFVAIAMIESTMAKWRFFRLPTLLMLSVVVNAIAIGLLR